MVLAFLLLIIAGINQHIANRLVDLLILNPILASSHVLLVVRVGDVVTVVFLRLENLVNYPVVWPSLLGPGVIAKIPGSIFRAFSNCAVTTRW